MPCLKVYSMILVLFRQSVQVRNMFVFFKPVFQVIGMAFFKLDKSKSQNPIDWSKECANFELWFYIKVIAKFVLANWSGPCDNIVFQIWTSFSGDEIIPVFNHGSNVHLSSCWVDKNSFCFRFARSVPCDNQHFAGT